MTETVYLKHIAEALEAITGTSGAEENMNIAGYLKRIDDATAAIGTAFDAQEDEITALEARAPLSLFRSTVPFVQPSSGSMGNNGALTLTVALFAILPSAYVYLPANAIVAGSAAGWYYTTFSSTTVGTVFNNVYNPAVGGVPAIPGAPTAFVTTGPGAFTGVVTLQQGITYTMPANTMGVNGKLRIDTLVRVPAAANSKIVNIRSTATGISGSTLFNNGTGGQMTTRLAALGSTSRQASSTLASGTGITVAAPENRTFDLTTAQVINVATQIINAGTENLVIDDFEVILEAP